MMIDIKKQNKKKFSDRHYTNFHDLNVPKDRVQYEPFTIIYIDLLLVYESKYYLQIYLDNCANKIIDRQMIIFLVLISFLILINGSNKLYIRTELI